MNSRFGLIVRYVLFCLFFTVGAAAITLSILIDPEISTCLTNRRMLHEIRRQNEKIADLTAQYEAQINLVRTEPNVLRRLERVTFGTSTHLPEDASAADLPPGSQALRQTAQSILADMQKSPAAAETDLPSWFLRCRKPRIRTALFAAGSGLILITFLFFGSPRIQAPRRRLD